MPTWIIIMLVALASAGLLSMALKRRWIGFGERDERVFVQSATADEHATVHTVVIRRDHPPAGGEPSL